MGPFAQPTVDNRTKAAARQISFFITVSLFQIPFCNPGQGATACYSAATSIEFKLLSSEKTLTRTRNDLVRL